MKKGISLFYILTLLLLVAHSSLFAGASLEVTPHDTKVQAGSEFTVSIELDTDTSIMSCLCYLAVAVFITVYLFSLGKKAE